MMTSCWQAVVGHGNANDGNSNSEHYDVLNNVLPERYSCRGFLSDCMPRATIERILVAAQRTASWCNAQPWQIAILTGAATIRIREKPLEHVQHVRSQPDLAWPLDAGATGPEQGPARRNVDPGTLRTDFEPLAPRLRRL